MTHDKIEALLAYCRDRGNCSIPLSQLGECSVTPTMVARAVEAHGYACDGVPAFAILSEVANDLAIDLSDAEWTYRQHHDLGCEELVDAIRRSVAVAT